MIKQLILKNLLQRPLRYLLTGLTVTFGVASVTAVFIFTGGLRSSFDEVAESIESGYDILIQTSSPFGDGFERAKLSPELLDEMQNRPEVAVVQPRIYSFGVTTTDDAAESVAGLGLGWEGRTPNPRLFLAEGKLPDGDSEFMVDVDTFTNSQLTLGNTYTVGTPGGSNQMILTGTFSQGSAETNTAFVPLFGFDETTALHLLNSDVGYQKLNLILEPNQDVEAVLAELRPELEARGQNIEAITLEQAILELQGDFGEALDIFRTVLLAFSVIILLVATFLVFNVFNITLSQRIAELGLLRALGAAGSQVSQLMFAEALLLGTVATALGIPAGWGLAWLMRLGLKTFGFQSEVGLPVKPSTLLFAASVGLIVTVLASAWPALKARRTSPMAALTDVAELRADTKLSRPIIGFAGLALFGLCLALTFTQHYWLAKLVFPVTAGLGLFLFFRWTNSRLKTFANFAVLALGLGLLTASQFVEQTLGETFSLIGAGAGLTLVGVSLVSPAAVAPLGRALGWHPTAAIVGLVGVGLLLAPIGVFLTALQLAAEQGSAIWLLMLSTPFLLLTGYGLVRTAYSSFGLVGRLGRDNATRNPQRTATTATAMMIGLTLVTAVTVIGDSIKTSVTEVLGNSLSTDWVVQSPIDAGPRLPFSVEAIETLEALPEVSDAVSNRVSREGLLTLSGDVKSDEVQVALPQLFAALDPRVTGEEAEANERQLEQLQTDLGADHIGVSIIFATDLTTLDDYADPSFVTRDVSLLDNNGVYVVDDFADDRDLEVGDTFVTLFLDGKAEEVTVAGIYRNEFVLGPMAIDLKLWDAHIDRKTDDFVTVLTAEGVTDTEARAAIETALEPGYPQLQVLTLEQFADEAETQINIFLAAINVLLLLSAAIAVLGIAVALSLAVFERTREIGLLRAIGTTRQQTRWMIRWEGVIVAAFGGTLGVFLGVGLGVLAASKMPEVIVLKTSVPYDLVAVYIIVAALSGLAAGAFPAWIAGRLNVLEAISTE